MDEPPRQSAVDVGQDLQFPGDDIFTKEYEDPLGHETQAPFAVNYSPTSHSLRLIWIAKSIEVSVELSELLLIDCKYSLLEGFVVSIALVCNLIE